jgi:coniferyl-aldehyde dehydrogenase
MVAKVANIADHHPQLRAMEQIFQAQKRAYAAHPMPSADERISLIKRLKTALLQHQDQDALVAAVNQDFGNRCASETLFAELISLLEAIKYYTKHIPKWMKPETRHVPFSLRPAQAKVIYQPLGVVGIIVPWIPLLSGPWPRTGGAGGGQPGDDQDVGVHAPRCRGHEEDAGHHL